MYMPHSIQVVVNLKHKLPFKNLKHKFPLNKKNLYHHVTRYDKKTLCLPKSEEDMECETRKAEMLY